MRLPQTKRKYFFTIYVFAKVSIRRYFRDRVAIFFTIAFPLIFLFIFGGLFNNANEVSFHVGVINEASNQFSQNYVNEIKKNKAYKIDSKVTNLNQATTKMGRGEIDATLVLPPDFGTVKNGKYPSGQAIIYYDKNNEQAAQTLATITQGSFDAINTKFVKVDTPFKVETKATNQSGLSRFDYTFSGLLGFTIIGLGIFGPVNYFPEMKKQGVLRRLHITPLRVWQFFVSSVLSNSVIGLVSVAVMFSVALTVFDFKMNGSYLQLAPFIVFGILTIFGIGLAIGGWAKNENQAAPLANIVVFPMMFLTGVFFPRFLMPEWLQHVSAFLPLTPIVDGIRMLITENKSLLDLGPQLGLMAVWTVVIYLIAFRVFRWE